MGGSALFNNIKIIKIICLILKRTNVTRTEKYAQEEYGPALDKVLKGLFDYYYHETNGSVPITQSTRSNLRIFLASVESTRLSWNLYMIPFSWNAWFVIFFILGPAYACITCVYRYFKINTNNVINSFNLFRGFCKQGAGNPPDFSQRIIVVTTQMFAVVIWIFYGTFLYSILFSQFTNQPYKNFEEFVSNKSYEVFISDVEYYDFEEFYSDFNASVYPLSVIPEIQLYETFPHICKNKIGIISAWEPFYLSDYLKLVPCNYYLVENPIRFLINGFVIARNTPLKDFLQQYTISIKEHHLTQYELKDRQKISKKKFFQFPIEIITPLLIILLMGTILAFMVLICEIIYFKKKNAH